MSDANANTVGHTPGSWTINRVSATTVNGGGHVVAACGAHQNNMIDAEALHAEQCANARLIAAAPDLLRELRNMVASLRDCMTWIDESDPDHADARRHFECDVAKASAVIAQATRGAA